MFNVYHITRDEMIYICSYCKLGDAIVNALEMKKVMLGKFIILY